MTDEVGAPWPLNYFSRSVEETVETPNGRYVQRAYDSETETYEIQVREIRYGKPTVISPGIKNLEDANQILHEGKENGIVELMERVQ